MVSKKGRGVARRCEASAKKLNAHSFDERGREQRGTWEVASFSGMCMNPRWLRASGLRDAETRPPTARWEFVMGVSRDLR